MSSRFSRSWFLGFLLLGIVQVRAEGPKKEYLALGDSLPFGFNPFLQLGDLADYHGYPQFVAASSKLNLANASCVGETSSSFLDVTAPDLGCHDWRAAPIPMFVAYTALTQSQNSYAVAFLRANPKTRLVTITIGGNDLGLLQAGCAAAADVVDCEIRGLPAVYATFARNLTAIYYAIRFEAGYEGPIVAVNYFSPDYNDPLITQTLAQLNAITLSVTAGFRGKVADAFSAFQAASVPGAGLPCAPNVGLALANPGTPLTCNPHPTAAGQQLMAQLIGNLVK